MARLGARDTTRQPPPERVLDRTGPSGIRLALRRFRKGEAGSGTVSSLYWAVTILILSGVALDSSNAYREQNLMQITADAVALAAAAHISDPDAGRQVAQQVIALNLGAGTATLNVDDVAYGVWDTEASVFRTDADVPNAVVVRARRSEERNNELGQFLLQLAGIPGWQIGATSVAAFASDNDEKVSWGCGGAIVLTSGHLHLGGSNWFGGPVCLHGELGIVGGVSNYFGSDVRLSAASFWDVNVGDKVDGSAEAEDITFERSLLPRVIPTLYDSFRQLERELMGMHGQAYTGSALPVRFRGFVVHELANVNTQFVEEISGDNKNGRQVVPQPGMIYYTPGSVSFDGNFDMSDVVVVARNSISASGGYNLKFEDVFFFGSQRVQLAGNIDWGSVDTFCDGGEYGTYLLSEGTVSFGGSAGAYGILAAAPTLSIGGSFTGLGGLYIESDEYQFNFGGNAHIDAYCETPLVSSTFPTVQPYGAADYRVQKALLIR